eukprot:CAMPEP_0178423028 /NCGR_PEP_ID=MMETSP0689_2-20121128/27480_1 /TAXON_ID=160604 /ORGANISM="Amphidinium massartii, Strain CS-259" /LENGTH=54 /DNA_ID=CAMNT_0020044615 /DNA_START=115 /DNA_END=278 /DNA_ORIENTATION=+
MTRLAACTTGSDSDIRSGGGFGESHMGNAHRPVASTQQGMAWKKGADVPIRTEA